MKKHLLNYSKKIIVLAIISLTTCYAGYAQYGEDLLSNGNFEEGIGEWVFKAFGGNAGSVELDTQNGIGGSKCGKIVMTDVSGGMNKAATMPDTLYNLDLGQYYFTAWAKASDGMQAKFGAFQIDENGGKKYPGYKEPLMDLTSEYKEYRGLLTPRKAYMYQTVLRVQTGDALGEYYIDDFTFQKVNDFPNADFEDEKDYFFAWQIDSSMVDGAVATYSKETTNVNGGSAALKVDVTAASDTAGDVAFTSMYHHFVTPEVENSLNFYAKGSNATDSIWVVIKYFSYTADDKYILDSTLRDSLVLSTEYALYSIPYTTPVGTEYVQYRINAGNQVSTLYFDDFSTGAASTNELSIDSEPLTTAMVGVEYSYQVSYTGVGTFTLETDPAADWLSINETGLVSGTPSEAGNVDVTIKLSDGTNEVSQNYTLTVNPVSVDLNNQNLINVYPNPAADVLNVSGAEGSVVNIYTLTGKLMLTKQLDSNDSQIDIVNLQKGLYLVSVIDGSKNKTLKVIVE